MTRSHPFRFGVLAYGAPTARAWREVAVRAEDLGYATLLVADHFQNNFAPFSALAVAATATTRLRIGSLVIANDFRHPAVLAKEAATIDLLSDGRFELGIGTGYAASDYAQTGISYDSRGVRVARLEESIAVVKGLMSDEPFSFAGNHYSVTSLDGRPKPAQRPHPPLLIGGGGPRILALAARHADIIGLNFRRPPENSPADGPHEMTPPAIHRKLGWIKDSAGDRFDDIELNVFIYTFEQTQPLSEAAAALGRHWNMSASDALDSPFFLLGDQQQIIDTLQRRRAEFGISYVVVKSSAMKSFAPIVRLLSGR